MSEHIDDGSLHRDRVAAIATRLINRAWFRVGSERYARESSTFGITTLRKRHVSVRGHRIAFRFRAKHRAVVRTTLVDGELAEAMQELLSLRGGRRPVRYEWEGGVGNLAAARVNESLSSHAAEEFTATHRATWGRTVSAASAC